MPSSYFYRPTGFDDAKSVISNNEPLKNNINGISDPDEFLKYLLEENNIYNNMESDIRSIREFLASKKNNERMNFMYEQSQGRNDVNPEKVQAFVDPTRSSDAFIISNTGNRPQDVSDVNYRITLRNSDNIKQEDVESFIQTFQQEALKRGTYIRCKIRFEQSDGVIFYVDKNNLLETVKILEDLKDDKVYGTGVLNAIKSFGSPQPFSATIGNSPYYAIAMHGVEPTSRLKSSLGGGLLRTFNEYMDDCLELTYNKLLMKYGNDASKISASEFYKEMVAYHTNRMGVGEVIPLWMNNRIYDDLNNKLSKTK